MTGFLISAALGFALALALAFFLGKKDVQKTKAEAINEAALAALHLRERLRRDAGYAERVRKRFTR